MEQPNLFSDELACKINERNRCAVANEHERFIEAHSHGVCYVCGIPYDQYNQARPCPHWLLRPSNIKKDVIASVFKKYGFFRPQSFLRWVANTESFGTQINDLLYEDNPKKIFETTINYKNFGMVQIWVTDKGTNEKVQIL